jgi:hypothetical protein
MARQRLIPVMALAGTVALASTLIANPLLTGGQHVSAAAARLLRAASRTAVLQPAPVLQAGQYAYTKSEGAYLNQQDRFGHFWGALVRTTREIWIAPDGSGRIRQHSDTPVFLGPGDRARWKAAGSPPLTELSETYDRRFGRGGLAPPLDIDGLRHDELLRLAADPNGLASAIRALAEKNSNPLGYEMLTIVGDILGESAAPPRLRASLYQVAATIPGIELVGTVKDRAGRTGVAVAANRDDLRHELIFDPKTAALLAQEETLRHRVEWVDAPSGTPIAHTLYLRSEIVRSTKVR